MQRDSSDHRVDSNGYRLVTSFRHLLACRDRCRRDAGGRLRRYEAHYALPVADVSTRLQSGMWSASARVGARLRAAEPQVRVWSTRRRGRTGVQA
jgi:hypothetical protein